MKRISSTLLVALVFAAHAGSADTLIRNARVHTASSAGTLEGTDVLIRDGRIAAIGRNLSAASASVVDAKGQPLTPGLFGGVNTLGIEEVSAEIGTVDYAYTPAATTPPGEYEMRPEFDVADAYNPDSLVIPVQRVEGVTFDMVTPRSLGGGSLMTGLGGIALFDGRSQFLAGTQTLFVALGTDASPLTGKSRAAQLMLLRQAFAEAKSVDPGEHGLLTDAGRATLVRFSKGGRVAFSVNRAIDIERAVSFAKQQGLKPVIVGGIEAWKVARLLAAEQVPVVLNPLANLPADFDSVGASLESAAWLAQAGVPVVFMLNDDSAHNARKLRQAAGNAVAHGLEWDIALKAITARAARTFGVLDRGEIAVGQYADLVLWNGDPLEVSTLAQTVWIEGVEQPRRSRQIELRERYRPSDAGP